MKTNYIVFVAVSLLVLLGWNHMVLKKAAPAPDTAVTGTAVPGQASPAAGQAPSPVGPVVRREIPVEKTVGRHNISFNAHGAGILQWRIGAGVDTPLVVPSPNGRDPLAAFPDLTFTEAPAEGSIDFTAERPDGLKLRASYKIDPDGFLHSLTIKLKNVGRSAMDVPFALGWSPGVESSADKPAEERAVVLDGDRVIDLIKTKKTQHTGTYRWFAADAPYFMAAFINDEAAPLSLTTEKVGKLPRVQRDVKLALAPGQETVFTQRFYLGPKSYDELSALGLGLEKAVDFGFFSTLGRWIHRALITLQAKTHNFGWAIIILTFCVQVLLSPLTVSSFKHSQKMKTLQPQLARLKEMYKNDAPRMNQEMLALYKRHGLRFMGMEGCMPAIVQMPVFFALYATLSKTYELRHAPWVGWVTDLSVHDPFFVLPVLMGGAMFAQQKITMSPSDPTQKQMMYMMPIMFTFIFLKMPAGLVLYWLTQNLLSLALQLYLLKRESASKAVVL